MLITKPYYKETQKFTQWWLWVVVLISTVPVAAILILGFFKQIILGVEWGSKPMSDSTLIIVMVITLAMLAAVLWLFVAAELTIEVRDRAIFYSFPPLLPKMARIGLEEIESWEVRRYSAIGEYGGLGWRGFGKKKGYIVRGNQGLQLILGGSKKLLLGTQEPDDLKKAVEREFERIGEY